LKKKSINECNEAIEVGRKEKAGFELIAKAYLRIASAYIKQEKYEDAIKAYKESLTEHRTPETLEKLNNLEKLRKDKEEKAYLSKEKSLEEKEIGNKFFKEGKPVEAINHYKEAIKRNPEDHVLYHNISAAYMKLGEFGLAIKNLNKCIELDPTYVKAYDRLGQAHFFIKEYHKAIQTFEKGLKIEPENKGLKEGLKKKS